MIGYDKLEAFMKEYFEYYSKYAQDAESMPKMDRFWTEDIKVTAYFQLPGGEYPFRMPNRRVWQDFLIKGHLTIWENLSPGEMTIDTKKLRVTSMLNVIKFDRKTDKKLIELDGIGYYTLMINDKGEPQIKSLDFFTGDAGTFASLYTQE